MRSFNRYKKNCIFLEIFYTLGDNIGYKKVTYGSNITTLKNGTAPFRINLNEVKQNYVIVAAGKMTSLSTLTSKLLLS